MKEDTDWKQRALDAEKLADNRQKFFDQIVEAFNAYKLACQEETKARGVVISQQALLLCEKDQRIKELTEQHAIRDGIAAQREALIAEKDKEILELHDEVKEAMDDYWKAFNLSKGYSTL